MGWAKFDDQFTDHPKVVAAGPMAELLAMRAVIHCARYETDGHVQAAQLPRLALGITSPKKQVAALVAAGLWEECDNGWIVHDFLDYHPSKAEQDEKREQARERMANNRAKKKRRAPDGSPDVRANETRSAGEVRPTPTRPDPNPNPNPRTATTSDVPSNGDSQPDISVDARQLTREFAIAVKANKHPVPEPPQKAHRDWLIEMDRLLRIGPPGWDGEPPDVDEVRHVIRWATTDDFELANVQSVPKFRKRYSQLRLKAINSSKPRASPGSRGVDYAARYDQAAAELERQGT